MEELRYEEPTKPEIETLSVGLNMDSFECPERAEALAKALNLSVNDKIREDSGDRFTINPKMVLSGHAPNHYKRQIEKVKIILTETERKGITAYYRKKKEDRKLRDALYYGITKRVEKLYAWDDENKKHRPIKNSKRSVEVCDALDYIHNSEMFHGFVNLIYHLLSKEDQDFVFCYKCAWFDKPIPNIQEWREEHEGEYWVLTDSEADYEAEEYLTDDAYLWREAVQAERTEESLDEWAKSVIRCDGRGSLLNGYDGSEEWEKVNETDYYIYRTN